MIDIPARVKDIEQAIFIGTDRNSTGSQFSDEPVDDSSAPARSSEHVLLDTLAIVSLSERCGRSSFECDGARLSESPTEVRPECSPTAGAMLAFLLAENKARLIDEALGVLNSRQLRVPFLVLPALLEYGSKFVQAQETVRAIGGRRASWLIALNEAWSTSYSSFEVVSEAANGDIEEIQNRWLYGKRKERRAVLQYLRTVDPDKARMLVEQTWNEEAAAVRDDILAQMRTGLAGSDEQFLERCLRDRSSGVRAKAVELLVSLPRSRLTSLAVNTADKLVTVTFSTDGLAALSLNLFLNYDDRWKMYAIEERAWIEGIGDQSWQALQWIALVPVTHWQERFQLTPQQLIDAAKESDYVDILMLAWSKSAKRTGDHAWCSALLSHWAYRRDTRTSITGFLPTVNDLNSEAEPFLMSLFTSESDILNDTHPAIQYLLAYDRQWSERLSILVLSSLGRTITATELGRGTWHTDRLLTEASLRISPSILDKVSKVMPADGNIPERWQPAVQSFYSTLALRSEMLKEMQR